MIVQQNIKMFDILFVFIVEPNPKVFCETMGYFEEFKFGFYQTVNNG